MRGAAQHSRAITISAIALAGLLGCERGPIGGPLVICHNSNCVEPPDPEQDDTPDALHASLALEDGDGVPLLDGVEIDTFWYGAEAQCLFAHDLAGSTSEPAEAAVEVIIDHLRGRRAAAAPATRSRGPFVVFIELKGHVGESKTEKHSAEQREQHAACAVGLLERLERFAASESHRIDVTFTSFDSSMLSAMRAALDAAGWEDTEQLRARLGVIQGTPAPLAADNEPLENFGDEIGIAMVTSHPHWIRDADYQAYSSRGWDLGFWMFSAVPETLAAIERRGPRWVTTSEAQLLTRWLDRR